MWNERREAESAVPVGEEPAGAHPWWRPDIPGGEAGEWSARTAMVSSSIRGPHFGGPHARLVAAVAVAAVALAIGITWLARPEEAVVGLASGEPVVGALDPGVPDPGSPDEPAAHPAATASTNDWETPSEADAAVGDGGAVVVHVAGRVKRPGVVRVETGARVLEAVEMAGGTRAGADLASVNLARVLVDGEQIIIPARAAQKPLVAGPPPGASGSSPAIVKLSTATPVELESLPGVGPVLAERIVAWREANGGFTTVEQLEQVSGIGPSILEQLRPLVQP